MSARVTLPDGHYLIGDLCYLDQEDADELFADYQPGRVRTLHDGRKYVYLNTAYGDGSYLDQDGAVYYVDSGTIGIIQYDRLADGPMGRSVYFPKPFEVYDEDGVLHFGDVVIDTVASDEHNEEDDGYEI